MGFRCPKWRGPGRTQMKSFHALAPVSSPPLPLLAFFAVFTFLWSFSQYTTCRERFQQAMVNFKLFLVLWPLLLIFIILSELTGERVSFRAQSPEHNLFSRRKGGLLWGTTILVVVVILCLVSYLSSFHSKWFWPM
ncbi:hypothetical protein NMG60_11014700 [Bertholletia excelsa]